MKVNKDLFVCKDEDLTNDKNIFNKMEFNGVEPSPEDERDFIGFASVQKKEFPEEYIAPETEILNQNDIGACVAHACATALAQGEENKQKAHNIYSRGYIYGNRAATDSQGEGMYTRQALKQLNHCGDVYYDDFPYNKKYPEVKALIEKDKEALAEKALPHTIKSYYRCYSDEQIKEAIMECGGAIVCVPVYSDFGRDLHVTKTNKLNGYHAMIIVGWTKENKWIVQNSWGKSWGYQGKLLMDNDYPVSEVWGIEVNIGEIQKKKSLFTKIIEFIARLLNNIVRLFNK